jgi:DNA-binding transcriptional ArsR family regulator
MPDAACREALLSLMPTGIVPVLRALATSEDGLCVPDLTERTGLPPATIRYALRKLRAAKCIGIPYETYVDGRRRFYRILGRGMAVLVSLEGGDLGAV